VFFWISHFSFLIKLRVVFSRILFYLLQRFMSSFFQKNHLDFTKQETKTKSNPDYFNLKTDRANEEKQEKIQNFLFVSAAVVFIVAFVAVIYA